jgi:hypothetical protein
MRYLLIGALMMLGVATTANAAVSVNIGINLPVYPRLVAVPGYPVYYAPGVNSNYFFYDGLYWVFNDDGWYSSSWYNGPWDFVDPAFVPSYVLQVPVRYYRRPPAYFRGWRTDYAPRWGDHWGRDWQVRRNGWDRRGGPHQAIAPLPNYQRQYSGNRYPQYEHQSQIHSQNYRYQPHEAVSQERYQRGPDNRGPDNRGPDNRGQENREQRGPDRGNDNRGGDRGGGDHGGRGRDR